MASVNYNHFSIIFPKHVQMQRTSNRFRGSFTKKVTISAIFWLFFLLKRYRFKCNYEIFNELGTSSSFCSLSFVIISLVTIMKNHHNRCLIVDFDLGLSMSLSHTPARAHTRAGVLLSFNSYLGSQCRFGLWSRPHFELDWFLPLEMFVAKALDLVAL